MCNQRNEMTFAVNAALQAGRTMRSGLGSAAALKGDGTPVTAIDKAINDAVAAAVDERSGG